MLNDCAWVMAEDVGDKQGLVSVMGPLGALYKMLGQHEKAIWMLEQALAISKEVVDREEQVDS